MADSTARTYCCIHAAIAAAEQARVAALPDVVTVDERRDLDRRASQRHEYSGGITYPKEYPPPFPERGRPATHETPPHARALDFCWHNAHIEREINAERWRALLIDARDWDCDLDTVRTALIELADLTARFADWEQRVLRLWSPAPEPPATSP